MESLRTQPLSSNLKVSWDGIGVEYSQMPPGASDVVIPKKLVSVAFAPQEQTTWRVDGGSSRTTPLPPGSVFLYSSREFVWSCWNQPTECVHMTLNPNLISRVAQDSSLSSNIEIEYRAIFADPTILHLAQLFKSEILNGGIAGKLYTESLANVLAVHLLRNYSGSLLKPALQDEPLDALKLNQLKEFIEEHLSEDLSIANSLWFRRVHFISPVPSRRRQVNHRIATLLTDVWNKQKPYYL
jgi:AraC family transcriptional regulator